MRENTDDSLDRGKRPSVSVTNSSGSPHWNEDSSMKWSEVSDSPASSSMARPSTKVQKSIGDKQTTGAYKKVRFLTGTQNSLLGDLSLYHC